MKINSHNFEAKNYEQAVLKAEAQFSLSEDEMIITVTEEGTQGIFGIGSKALKINVIPYTYIAAFVEEFVTQLIVYIGIDDANVDASFTNNIIIVNVNSSNNGILIGRNGKTLNSIIHITNQVVKNEVGQYVKVNVDVGDYKNIRVKQLERLAHSVSRNVAKTKIEAKLKPMNSYERRIIHEYLANDKYVITSSKGEEPNRYVVIKMK